jgi:hypothetical protein
MTEDKKKDKPVFVLPPEELANPKFRRGYPGRLFVVCPKSWDKEAPHPHPKFNMSLASYYKAGRFVGIRSELMVALNALLPPPKPRKKLEVEEEEYAE